MLPSSSLRSGLAVRAFRARRAPSLAALALLFLGGRAAGQQVTDVDVSGAWRVSLQPADGATAALAAPFKDKLTAYLSRSGVQITGLAMDKLGACGKVLVPVLGEQDGMAFTLDQSGAVPDPVNCTDSGTLTLAFDALLGTALKATALCTGTVDVGTVHAPLTFTAKLKRISGMQSPDDPDADGPGLPLDLVDANAPGHPGASDLAITKMKVVKTLKMASNLSAIQTEVDVTIQNRGQHTEVIEDLATLFALVTLSVEKVSGEQGQVLIEPRAPLVISFPQTIAPRKTFKVYFHVSFLPTDDPPGSTGLSPGVFAWTATVHHDALPGAVADDHPGDDVAPRSVAKPWTFDSYPDGKIKERGAGAKWPGGGLGAPVTTTYSIAD